MKLIPIISLALAMNACNMTEKGGELTFQKASGQAILIGDKMTLLDNSLNPMSNAPELPQGTMVTIQEISDSLFNESDDPCDAFKYVRIKVDQESGLIDGRNVYHIEQNQEKTSFNMDNRSLEIMTTTFFGTGVADDDGLTFCSKYNQPIVLQDLDTKDIHLIHLQKNDLTDQASWNKDFPFFELRADDGSYDKIINVSPAQDGVVLTVHREFQEGSNEYQVALKANGDGFQAEYTKYGEIIY